MSCDKLKCQKPTLQSTHEPRWVTVAMMHATKMAFDKSHKTTNVVIIIFHNGSFGELFILLNKILLTWSMTYAIIYCMNNSKTNSFAKTQHHVDKPHLFREIVRTYQTLMALFSRKSGVPASLFSLMRILAVADDDIGVMDLSGRLGIDAAAITRQVQKLERERLIHRHGDPEDGRRSYVSLTPKGQRMFDDIHERSHEFERSLLSAIGAKEMANAVEVLAKLRDFLSGLR